MQKEYLCPICNKKFTRCSTTVYTEHPKCSRRCFYKSIRKNQVGVYKGYAVLKNHRGYLTIFKNNKMQRLHRIIAIEAYGEKFLEGKIVHHKDGNKENNSLDNLEVMTQGKHISKHIREAKERDTLRILAAKLNPDENKVCRSCQEIKFKSSFYKDKSKYDSLSAYCKKCCKVNSAQHRGSKREKKILG